MTHHPHPQVNLNWNFGNFTPLFVTLSVSKNTCHESLAGPVDDTRIRDLSFFPTTPVNVKKVKKTPADFSWGEKIQHARTQESFGAYCICISDEIHDH